MTEKVIKIVCRNDTICGLNGRYFAIKYRRKKYYVWENINVNCKNIIRKMEDKIMKEKIVRWLGQALCRYITKAIADKRILVDNRAIIQKKSDS